ncbi:MAG: protein kinase [Planctomycetota bacterium]
MIGRQVGDYRIVAELGEGGMGMVYKGQHAHLGQIVAVKSLHPTLMSNQAAKDRFEREAQALARLNHPNIIGLMNFINDSNGCFIVMEFAEGEDLENKLQRMGLIPPPQCIPWFIEACRGLDYAHKQGIIHRDIKPSNIIVHPSGTTKLLDFGTAKLVDAQRLTQQGMTLGTVIYMSKEQLLGKPLDARSDVYSLGVTLYECVTGQLPFYDEEERKLVVKIAKEEPIPPRQHYPGISTELEGIILKAMAKEPAQRFQSAREMEQALAGLAEAGAGKSTAGGQSPLYQAPVAQPVGTPVATPAPVPTATPTPGPMPFAAPGGGGGMNVGELVFSPLFLGGLFLTVVGLGAGIPLAAVGEGGVRIAGLVILPLFVLLGGLLCLLGVLKARAAGGAAAAAPPGPAAYAPNPSWAAMGAEGTLNVDSPGAAQAYGAPPTPAPVQSAGNALLQVIDGQDKGLQGPITPGNPCTIGRAPTCTITLTDPGVSGMHASVGFEGPTLVLTDTGSRNGVFVNNQKVARQPLKAGDLIVIGSTRLLVNC